MIRKTLTILSLIGLLLSVGLWVMSYWRMNWKCPTSWGADGTTRQLEWHKWQSMEGVRFRYVSSHVDG